MEIRKAEIDDCRAIAELAQIAGDGIPGYFWADSQQPGQTLEATGAELLKSETANFSYRNALVACIDGEVAGMLLAYRLPADNDEDLLNYPEFVRPLVELEQCVGESFYINMLATFAQFRGRGIGTALMAEADRLANSAQCNLLSIAVFSHNADALRLYQALGYEKIEQRAVVACDYHPASEVLLLTRPVAA